MFRATAFALLTGFALAHAQPALSQENHEIFRAGNWIGVRYTDQAGNLDRCSAVAQYGNDVVLALTWWANGDVGLKISDLSWNLSPSEYTVGVMIDNRYIGGLPGAAEERYKININFGQDDTISTLLSRGHYLYIRSPELGVYSFPLVKSAAAMALLSQCSGAKHDSLTSVVSPEPVLDRVIVSRTPPSSLQPYKEQVVLPLKQSLLNHEMNPCAFGASSTSCSK